MGKRALTMLAGVAMLAMLVAGCGDSGDGGDEGLTKAEYVQEGTAICAVTLDEMQAVFREIEKQEEAQDGNSQNEIGTEFVKNDMLPAFETQLDELRELSPPAGDQAQLEKIYLEMEKGIAEVRKNIDGTFQFSSPPLMRARKMADKYGLNGCMAIIDP